MKDNNYIDIHVGDVLISHKKHYHYMVESINGNDAVILWLHRKAGEPCELYTYCRDIRRDNAARYYEIIPASEVDWSLYSNG